MKDKFLILIAVFIWFAGCRERYEPDIISSDQAFLVVEGNLNAAHDSTIIRLTRTFKLDDTARIRGENNANLTVEGSDNTVHNLMSNGDGYYVSPDLNLITGNEYRLRIRLSNGREYLSDFVKAKSTPGIDTITWNRDDEGVHLFLSTKDPSGSSRYYRWSYEETWEIQSYFFSWYIYENGEIRSRIFPDEDISTCWKFNKSSDILLANSVQLQEDIINDKAITSIPPKSEKLQVRYSILVKQYSLEKDAYNFFEIMKKNSEETGSFFAPLPSEISGNLHGINSASADRVIGYITVSAETKKRIFITIPQWGFTVSDCSSISVPKNIDSIRHYFGELGYVPYDDQIIPPLYYGTSPFCADCTKRGGITQKPSYW